MVPTSGPDFALIDSASSGWRRSASTGELLIGEVQLGERSADCLPALKARCLPAYVDGLCAEDLDVDHGIVRRAHALQRLLFSGLSALPFEHLDAPPTPQLHDVAQNREARSAAYILDLVDAAACSPAVRRRPTQLPRRSRGRQIRPLTDVRICREQRSCWRDAGGAAVAGR